MKIKGGGDNMHCIPVGLGYVGWDGMGWMGLDNAGVWVMGLDELSISSMHTARRDERKRP